MFTSGHKRSESVDGTKDKESLKTPAGTPPYTAPDITEKK